MKEAKFTKGPWHVANTSLRVVHVTSARGLTAEALIGYAASQGEGEANGRLISAAPEMYEALNESLQFLETLHTEDAYGACSLPIAECDCRLSDHYAAVKAALAKAVQP